MSRPSDDFGAQLKAGSGRRPWFARWSLVILMVYGLSAPLIMVAAFWAVRSNTNQVADWLPQSFAETGDLAWFREHFVGDQFVVISWDGCVIDGDADRIDEINPDPRIERLANLLVSDSPVGGRAEELPYSWYFKTVFTGPAMLKTLSDSESGIPFKAAKRRLVGSLLGPDQSQTCLIATLSDESLADFRKVLSRPISDPLTIGHPPGVLFEALGECGLTSDQVYLGGPPVDNVAIDEEGERTLIRLAGLSALLGLLLSWWSLRSVRLTIIVFACGILSAAAGLASIWVTGAKTDAIILSMPALVYVLAISGAIHLINYYRHVVDSVGAEAAPGTAIAMGYKPAVLCSVTTALGLLSLCTSDLVPIRKFGFYSAIGVLQILGILFLFLPAALYYWPPRNRISKKPNPGRDDAKETVVAADRPNGPTFWDHLGHWIVKHHYFVVGVFLVTLVGFTIGLRHYRTSIDLMKLFHPKARIIQDYRWLEANIGRLVPVEVVISFSPAAILPPGTPTPASDDPDSNHPGQGWSLMDRLEILAEVQRTMTKTFGEPGAGVIGPAMSALTFIPPLPRDNHGIGSIVRHNVMERRLESAYDSLLQSGYLTIDKRNGRELWRISLRVAAFEDVDYGVFTDSLKSAIDPVVARHRISESETATGDAADDATGRTDEPDIKAVYTGVVPIVYKAQTALLKSLVTSTIWSFMTITPLLMFVSRGFLAGLVAMIPNVLPVVVVFGGLSWLGWAIDIGSMMAASIALGVAVDDTIHYLTWYRASLNHDGDRKNAILSAYHHCATPTMQATIINGLGLSVFTISTFAPTRQFGLLMLVILFAGAVAELLLLPAILAGPLGRVFKPKVQSDDDLLLDP
jgi:uncharacterized protein